MFYLSKRSLNNLEGVHPLLVKVVKRAIEITRVDFGVIEGLRTVERQRTLLAEKKSKTMRSKHLKQPDGYGHAVDLFPGSWTDDAKFCAVHDAMQQAAEQYGVKLRWGGDFNGDGHTVGTDNWDSPHFELAQ